MSRVTMIKLREALEASWNQDTAYMRAYEEGNPAYGNCYPTSRVVQHFFPEMEVVHGKVWTGVKLEGHFWNVLIRDGIEYHIDLTWQQFPHGSVVQKYELRDRNNYEDDKEAIARIDTLLHGVTKYLKS